MSIATDIEDVTKEYYGVVTTLFLTRNARKIGKNPGELTKEDIPKFVDQMDLSALNPEKQEKFRKALLALR